MFFFLFVLLKIIFFKKCLIEKILRNKNTVKIKSSNKEELTSSQDRWDALNPPSDAPPVRGLPCLLVVVVGLGRGNKVAGRPSEPLQVTVRRPLRFTVEDAALEVVAAVGVGQAVPVDRMCLGVEMANAVNRKLAEQKLQKVETRVRIRNG